MYFCPAFCLTRFSFGQILGSHVLSKLPGHEETHNAFLWPSCSLDYQQLWPIVLVSKLVHLIYSQSLSSGWLSTRLTSRRSLRVAWNPFSIIRRWFVTSQACLSPMLPCWMRGRQLQRPCNSATGRQTLACRSIILRIQSFMSCIEY